MTIISTTLKEKEITKLALAATDVVHSMDLELPDLAETKARFIAMLDTLEAHYTDNELLFDARATILGQPTRKMDIYMLTHKLVKMARAGKPSVLERLVYMSEEQTTVAPVKTLENLSVAAAQH